jgi:eukaryotic-like serine/threonine-protein kinase
VSEQDVPTLPPEGGLDETEAAPAQGVGRTAPPGNARPRALPERGDRIGSFVVQRKLGAGAMGVVLLAVDPELDRRVAIKVLTSGLDEPVAQARFVREARSAARLQHPNVVTVHQVGMHEGQVYLVMEYVDGGTLRQWLKKDERTWPEILAVFRQAGTGLAAAHAAGLVHRDFKPDNVLIDQAGRVRVSDFGLVGETGEAVEALATESDIEVSDRLTRTGAVMGTPAYMSPEQMAGASLDARSDQFSFCVALYEALWGRRPFEGDTLATLVAALQREAEEPPRSEVPTQVRLAVMRGLSVEPDRRFPDMDALLRALAPEPPRRYGATAAIGGLVALSLGAAAFVIVSDDSEQPHPCPPVSDELGTLADPATLDHIRAAFEKSGHAHADAAFERLQDELNARTSAWIAAYQDACEAVTRQEDPVAVFEQRRSCLGSLRQELSTFADVLAADPDEALVDGTISVARSLGDTAICSDLARIRVQPKPTPDQARALQEVAPDLMRVDLLLAGGRPLRAKQEAEAVLPRARTIGFGPTVARTLLLRASSSNAAGAPLSEDDLRDAMGLAAEASDHATEAKAAAWLVVARSKTPEGSQDIESLTTAAEAAARRAGDPSAQATVFMAVATVLEARGDRDAALQRLDEAEQALHRMSRPIPDMLAQVIVMRGRVRLTSGDQEAGLADLQRAESLVVDELGEHHPAHGTILRLAGDAVFLVQDYAWARTLFARASESSQRALGPDSTSTIGSVIQHARAAMHAGDVEAARTGFADALNRCDRADACPNHMLSVILENLAWAELVTRQYEEAAKHYERALSQYASDPSAEHRSRVQRYLGYTYDAWGKHDEARRHFEGMREAEVALHGPKHEYVIWATNLAANSARYRGDCDTARDGYRRSLQLREDLGMRPGPYLAEIMAGLGQCELAQGRWEAARESLQTAYELRLSNIEPDIYAQIHFALAKVALHDGDREEALELARHARARLENTGVPRDALTAEVDAWLIEQGEIR